MKCKYCGEPRQGSASYCRPCGWLVFHMHLSDEQFMQLLKIMRYVSMNPADFVGTHVATVVEGP